MKYKELHKLIQSNGWRRVDDGKHPIYEKNGVRYPVPFHGGGVDVGKGLCSKIMKDLELK